MSDKSFSEFKKEALPQSVPEVPIKIDEILDESFDILDGFNPNEEVI